MKYKVNEQVLMDTGTTENRVRVIDDVQHLDLDSLRRQHSVLLNVVITLKANTLFFWPVNPDTL